jgi:hypothetical protein
MTDMDELVLNADEERWIDNALSLVGRWVLVTHRKTQIRQILTDLYLAGRERGSEVRP